MRLAPIRPLRWLDAVNVVVALALAGLGTAEIFVPLESRNYDGLPVLTAVSVWFLFLLLIFRRLARVGALAAAGAGLILLHLGGPLYVLFYGQMLPIGILLYSAVRHGRRPAPAAAGAIALVIQTFLLAVEPDMQNLNEAAFQYGVFALIWLAAFGLRVQARRVQASLQRAIEVEVHAAEQAMAAVNAERTRIARELHDIVAHSVSVMVVQAGAAEQMVDDDPDYVRHALATIRGTGTGALTEMRRLVGMLRIDDGTGSLHPQPGMASLPELITHARRSGLEVICTTDGDVRELPSGVDLAAYRIVREALTNVRRHARASSVDVRLRYGAEELAIEVADDGVGPTEGTPGHGLIGMRERAALYGGSLETEAGHGFMVRAVLPVVRA